MVFETMDIKMMELKKVISVYIGDKSITPANIFQIVTVVMFNIDKIYTAESGSSKKDICINLVNELLQDPSVVDKSYLESMLSNTIHGFIESIIEVSKNGFNKSITKKTSCFSFCKKKYAIS